MECKISYGYCVSISTTDNVLCTHVLGNMEVMSPGCIHSGVCDILELIWLFCTSNILNVA